MSKSRSKDGSAGKASKSGAPFAGEKRGEGPAHEEGLRQNRRNLFRAAIAEARERARADSVGDDDLADRDHEVQQSALTVEDSTDLAVAENPQYEEMGSGTPARSDSGNAARRGLRRTGTVIIAALTGLLAGSLFALSWPVNYFSQAEILIEPRGSARPDAVSTAGPSSGGAMFARIDSKARVISSGMVAGKVVDRLHLQRDPEFNTRPPSLVRWFDGMFGLKPVAIGETSRKLIAAANLQDALTVTREKGTFVVRIGARAETAQKAALIANTVTEVFLDANRNSRAKASDQARNEISTRLSELQNAVTATEERVNTFKAEHDLGKNGGQTNLGDEISQTAKVLEGLNSHIAELGARVASLGELDADGLIAGNYPAELSSPSLAALRDRYMEAKREVDRLSVNLGERHPRLREAKAQLDGARRDIRSELNRMLQSAQMDLKGADERKQELSARLADLKKRQADRASQLEQLRELERKASSARSLYENLTLKAAAASNGDDTGELDISVISGAQPPLSPAGPRRAIIMVLGGLIGLLLGLLFAARHRQSSDAPNLNSNEENGTGQRDAAKMPEDNAIQRSVREIERHGPDGSALWPSPDMIPANPYAAGPDNKHHRQVPAAFKGSAPQPPGRFAAGTGNADIAELNERLKAFREKVGSLSRSPLDKDAKN